LPRRQAGEWAQADGDIVIETQMRFSVAAIAHGTRCPRTRIFCTSRPERRSTRKILLSFVLTTHNELLVVASARGDARGRRTVAVSRPLLSSIFEIEPLRGS
jgi:hypothetical protein